MNTRAIKFALKSPLLDAFSIALTIKPFRRAVLGAINSDLREFYMKKGPRPQKVQEDKAAMAAAVINSLDKGIGDGRFSRTTLKKSLLPFSKMLFYTNEAKSNFQKRYNIEAPGFLTISPGAFCNLKCKGCYANSSAALKQKLDYDTVTRIIHEQKEYWGSHFTVISGGEPLLWESNDKTVFDLAKEHNDTYFQIFTNGVLLTPSMAKKFAEVGNITPGISVEGFEEETDARRGRGVYRRILHGFRHLREVGVPFGISVTVTRDNAEQVMSEEFLDYYLNVQGAHYIWLFQYMPIGRSVNLDFMVSPEQRLYMYKKTWELIREKKMFIADFWNCGTATDGCISAGIRNGYIYIDWNGNVMPCVFNPFFIHNIKDIYARGGTLNDALFSDFFKGIRKWEWSYVLDTPPDRMGNAITPCAIRDHYDMMNDLVHRTGARLSDEQSDLAVKGPEFGQCLINYGRRVAAVTDEVWQKEYLDPERNGTH
jgi:MoaA/NifB/PqqE/SkfB family radical SAM enzyme